MAEATTEEAEAKVIANDMDPDGNSIEHTQSKRGRHEFNHSLHVNAHQLPEGWEFLGFGSGWFAIGRE